MMPGAPITTPWRAYRQAAARDRDVSARHRDARPRSLAPMRYRTVCISSEDGTGALGAAMLAAKSLGLRVIDEDIVTRAAVEAGVDRDVVADVEQRKSKLVRLIEGLGPVGMGTGYVVAVPAVSDLPP